MDLRKTFVSQHVLARYRQRVRPDAAMYDLLRVVEGSRPAHKRELEFLGRVGGDVLVNKDHGLAFACVPAPDGLGGRLVVTVLLFSAAPGMAREVRRGQHKPKQPRPGRHGPRPRTEEDDTTEADQP